MKKSVAIILALLLLISVYTPVLAQDTVKIYVAVTGSDSAGDGSVDNPFLTLEKAKGYVKQLRTNNELDVPVEVIFREGTYRFSSKVKFKATDSGTESSPTIYRAEEGETVKFKGSVLVNMKDFKIADSVEILSRLPKEAHGRVLALDLKTQGIDSLNPKRYYNEYVFPQSVEYIELFLNENLQPIAQWPNGMNVYTRFDEVVAAGGTGEKASGGTVRINNERLKNWVTALDAWADIWTSNDYYMDVLPIESVNAEENTVKFGAGAQYPITGGKSQRFKIKNLLEELDRPGEWYVDTENLMLYYYPEKELTGNDILEIAVAEDDLIDMTDVKHTSFENITFSQLRGSAFYMLNRCEYITIDNCRFENIAGAGIWHFSQAVAPIGQSTTQHADFRANGCRYITITNNYFDTIGNYAIRLRSAGSFDTLEQSHSKIENNYFSNIRYIRGSGSGLSVNAVACDIKNNLIHNTHGGIYFLGIDNKVSNNEIYNVQKYESDAGAIYTGKNFLMRDNDIFNNYVKDVSNTDVNMTTNNNRFVYIDDFHPGINVYNNIFVGHANGGVLINGGQFNKVHHNVFVNNNSALLVNSWRIDNAARITLEQTLASDAKGNEAYSRFYEDIDKGISETYLAKPAFNEVYNNIMYNGKETVTAENLTNSTISNNIQVETDVFEDFENGDYRIKSSELISQMPDIVNKNNFSYDKTGIAVSKFYINPVSKSNFTLLYPHNKSIINEKLGNFMWQRAKGADKYQFIVAEDKEFNNIIEDKIVYETATTVKLEENKIYYWKVKAYNESLHFSGQWECEEVFAFATGEKAEKKFDVYYEPVDFSDSFNAKIFAPGERKIEDFDDPTAYIGSYSKIDGVWTPTTQRVLNKTIFDNQRDINGYIYSNSKIPFAVNTSGGVALGGRTKPTQGANISIKGVYADKIHMLTCATANTQQDPSKKYEATIIYTNGDEVTQDINIKSMQSAAYDGEYVTMPRSYMRDASGQIVVEGNRYFDVMTIDTDAEKCIKDIYMNITDPYGGWAILGITAEFTGEKNSLIENTEYENIENLYGLKSLERIYKNRKENSKTLEEILEGKKPETVSVDSVMKEIESLYIAGNTSEIFSKIASLYGNTEDDLYKEILNTYSRYLEKNKNVIDFKISAKEEMEEIIAENIYLLDNGIKISFTLLPGEYEKIQISSDNIIIRAENKGSVFVNGFDVTEAEEVMLENISITGVSDVLNSKVTVKGCSIENKVTVSGGETVICENTVKNDGTLDINSSQCIIKDNMLVKPLSVSGDGALIVNNIIHNTTSPVKVKGSKNFVAFNEIYNIPEGYAIYAEGANYICYNNIHHTVSAINAVASSVHHNVSSGSIIGGTVFANTDTNESVGNINNAGLMLTPNGQYLSIVNFDASDFGIKDVFAAEMMYRLGKIKPYAIQDNNSFEFVWEDGLETGNYSLYYGESKLADTQEKSYRLDELPVYGQIDFKVVPHSLGLKLKSIEGENTERFSVYRITNFECISSNGEKIENINDYLGEKIIIKGNINNKDNLGDVLIAFYGKRGDLLKVCRAERETEVVLPEKEIKEIKVLIWKMDNLNPLDNVCTLYSR